MNMVLVLMYYENGSKSNVTLASSGDTQGRVTMGVKGHGYYTWISQ